MHTHKKSISNVSERVIMVRDWAIKSHIDTNHKYDKLTDYEFHLQMVVNKAKKYSDIGTSIAKYYGFEFDYLLAAGWLHDVVEDARQNYNAIVKLVAVQFPERMRSNPKYLVVPEIVRAVTNYNRGRDRDERMPDFVYADIRNTPGAPFIKLCDRLANSGFSDITESSMKSKYTRENEHFINSIMGDAPEYHQIICAPMIKELHHILTA